jgi:transaldolase
MLYVEPLIGPETINTMPDVTLNAFRDHGEASNSVGNDLEAAQTTFAELESLGIGHESVGQELQVEGVRLFEEAYTALLAAVA